MKYIFIIGFVILVTASWLLYFLTGKPAEKVPVIYWVTDANPAREQQIETFHKWLKKHGYPRCEVRLDTANNDLSKRLIQGVSGVSSDIIDSCGGQTMRYFQQIGMLTDLTDWAKKLNFGPDQTFAVMEPEITIDGRQYAFPCNVFTVMLWVNKATFERYGIPLPSTCWTLDDFERLGKQFVAAANKGQVFQTRFFADDVQLQIWRRSLGLDVYNETMTRCILDDERNIRLMQRVHKWIYQDRILPNTADRLAFSTEGGYGGSSFQLFNSGNYAMVWSGRWALIQFREFKNMQLAVVEPPNGGYPNTIAGTRASAVYGAGQNQYLAKYFMAFLASEEYNMNIVADADALPPNPKYTRIKEFTHPSAYPNEWGCHERFAEAALNIAIARSSSPFVLQSVANRRIHSAEQAFMANLITAAEAAKQMASRVNLEIARTLAEDPRLKTRYEKQKALQKKIEAYRAAGRKVPLEWISNPFYRKYYTDMGWAVTKTDKGKSRKLKITEQD